MTRTGRYELVDRIGVGGMAEVFRAWALDSAGHRSGEVVVKRILPHLSADPEYREMFIDEAKIAATLDHRNIVRLLDLGRLDGQLFLALELVDGADLEKLLRRARAGGLRFPFAISTFVITEVLFALHHAHTRIALDGRPLALVHRDVAPGNVLLSRDGAVKLSDFGVAKAATRGGRTVAGVVKGNPMYMPPEQILGNAVDARSDVYAVGILLLTLLAGKHPFEGLPMGALIDRVLRGEIPRASRLASDVPPELEELAARATARDPDQRFSSAGTFLDAVTEACTNLELKAGADDLARVVARLLEGGAEVGAPPSLSIVGRLDALISGSIEPTPLPEPEPPRPENWRGARYGTNDALETTPAPSASSEGFETYAGPMIPAADDGERTPLQSALFADNEGTPAWDAMVIADPETELTNAIEELYALATPELTPIAPPVPGLFVPDGQPAGLGPRSVPDGILRGHRQAVSAVVSLGTGVGALSASHDQTLRLWEVASREERAVLKGHMSAVTSIALSGDGSRAISGGRDRLVRLWNLTEEREAGALSGHEGWIFSVAIDPTARVAVSGGLDRVIRVWDLALGACAGTLAGHTDTVAAVALFAEGRRALSGSYDRTVKLWDVERGHEIASLESADSIRALAVSPNGRLAVSGGADMLVSLWDLERGLALHRFAGHLEPVVALAFSPDGRHALSGSYDGTARLWEIESGAPVRIFSGTEPVMSVTFSRDGAFVLLGRANGTIELWGLGAA